MAAFDNWGPEQWFSHLERAHDAELPALEWYDDHYRGEAEMMYMHPALEKEIGDRVRPVVYNWPSLVIDSVDERLDVDGFRLVDVSDDIDQDLQDAWIDNEMPDVSQQVHLDAVLMRRSFVSISMNDDGDLPIISGESPLQMYLERDPRTKKSLAALKRINSPADFARLEEKFATLHLLNETIWYEWTQGQWTEVDRDEHNFGALTVVPFINKARLSTRGKRSNPNRLGQSDLDPILPLSNAANKLATDMMVGAEFAALPMRGFFGLTDKDMVDSQGNRKTAFEILTGRLLNLTDREAKSFEFAAADLSNFHKALDHLARVAAALSGLPFDYFGLASVNPPSAESRNAGQDRLIKRAERKQRPFGSSWRAVGRLVHRFMDDDWDPKFRKLECVWRNPATPTLAQAADAAVKKFETNIVPLRQTREDLGYTQIQIERMEAEDAKKAANDPLTQIREALVPPDRAELS